VTSGAPHGMRSACATDGSACGGSCDGSSASACGYPGASTQCRARELCRRKRKCPPAPATAPAPAPPPPPRNAPHMYAARPPAGRELPPRLGLHLWRLLRWNGHLRSEEGGRARLRRVEPVRKRQLRRRRLLQPGLRWSVPGVQRRGQRRSVHAGGGAPHGARPACATDGSSCGGSCDGLNVAGCAYPTAQCRSASCSRERPPRLRAATGRIVPGASDVLVQPVCLRSDCLQDELRLGFDCAASTTAMGRAPASEEDGRSRLRRVEPVRQRELHRWGLLQPSLQRTMPGVQRRGLRRSVRRSQWRPARGTPCLRERRFSLRRFLRWCERRFLWRTDRAVSQRELHGGSGDGIRTCNGAVPARQRSPPPAIPTSARHGVQDDLHGGRRLRSGDYCDAGGACVPKKADGLRLRRSKPMRSGTARTASACNQACGGQCQACDVPGTGRPMRRGQRRPATACRIACSGSDLVRILRR